MQKLYFLSLLCVLFVVSSCATINVTKTGKGYFDQTKADDVEILVLAPQRPYSELATVTTYGWETMSTAKMHNSLRSKCAPLGADAVVLTSSGFDKEGKFWTSGVAIKYKN
jgi:hypothetical protein